MLAQFHTVQKARKKNKQIDTINHYNNINNNSINVRLYSKYVMSSSVPQHIK